MVLVGKWSGSEYSSALSKHRSFGVNVRVCNAQVSFAVRLHSGEDLGGAVRLRLWSLRSEYRLQAEA